MLIFDIETGPLEPSKLREIMPAFDVQSLGSPPSAEFDPSTVRLGLMKDQAKIDAKIADARAKHSAELAGWQAKCEKAEADYWAEIEDSGALKPHTGEVLAIGYRNAEGKTIIDHRAEYDEAKILMRWWVQFQRMRASQRHIIGFNSNGFDVPFLVRRSWILGVSVPSGVFTPAGYLCQTFIDLLSVWQCGNRRDWISLDVACRALGLGGKSDDCTGALFYKMFRDPDTRDAALNYLGNDLLMTHQLANRLGVS